MGKVKGKAETQTIPAQRANRLVRVAVTLRSNSRKDPFFSNHETCDVAMYLIRTASLREI
jgi:hypothetical protein